LPFLAAWPLARRRPSTAGQWVQLRERFGSCFADFTEPRNHHLVVAEIDAVSVPEKIIGAVDVLRVDRRHDEGRHTRSNRGVPVRQDAVWLIRSGKAGREGEGVGKELEQRRAPRGRGKRRLEAR